MPTSEEQIDIAPGAEPRVALVTGANSGLGLETARGLADRGFEVVMASRNVSRSAEVAQRLREEESTRRLELMRLDLGDLDSVEAFASELRSRYERLDLLVNNAGVMGMPWGRSAQGLESHMAINHLGHFALSGRLLPMLTRSRAGRVVVVSSLTHQWGQLDLETLGRKLELSHPDPSAYDWMAAYAASKLANLVFSFEFDRRLRTAGQPVISLAAHPGYSSSDIGAAGARAQGSRLKESFFKFGNRVLAQPAAKGAAAMLHAAVSTDMRGGEYIGPDGLLQMRGAPKEVSAARRARDLQKAVRLWERSVEATGVDYEGL
jgi:NAD(P)-dependent dehydrogenase (short-subunit alcohol dehydrogenase family)